MHRHVPEADRLLETLGQARRYEIVSRKNVERLAHRIWGGRIQACDQVRGDIHAQLNGAREIHGYDVLQVRVALERSKVRGRFVGDALDAPAKRFELFFD
jgi:hypothetical protein